MKIKQRATYNAGPYKGYFGYAEYDQGAGLFHGDVVGTRDVITFEGRTVDELRMAFQESVDDYLDFCRQRGEKPEKPFSGKFVVRIDPKLHWQLSMLAEQTGKSLNALVAQVLESAAHAAQPVPPQPAKTPRKTAAA